MADPNQAPGPGGGSRPLSEGAPARERVSVQWLLRAGLAVSFSLMLLGLALSLLRHESTGRPFALRDLLASATPLADRLVGAGILVLAATPALRVLALLLLWAEEKDWRFVAVALAVIATLGAALALGGG